jgi:hypothetical protein
MVLKKNAQELEKIFHLLLKKEWENKKVKKKQEI